MKTRTEIVSSANDDVSYSEFIPFRTHLTESIIKLKDSGAYITTFKLEGISFETEDPISILHKKDVLVNLYRTLSGGEFSVWTHKIRRKVHVRLEGKYDNQLCRRFAEEYYRSFDNYNQISTELYLTVVYRPYEAKAFSLIKKVKGTSLDELRQKEETAISVLDDKALQVLSLLKSFNPERLSTFDVNGIIYSEQLSFYGYLVNGFWVDVPLYQGDISKYLPSSKLYFGDNNGLLEIHNPLGKKYVGFIDIKDYPRFSEPGMNDVTLYGDHEYIETQSFSILNRRDATRLLETQRGRLSSAGDVAVSEIVQIDGAIELLNSNRLELGEFHFSLAVIGSSIEIVAKKLAETTAALDNGPQFKMAIMDVIPECGWFAQLPGNWKMRPREASITSKNFASLAPFHGFASGKRKGNPWGEALAMVKTPSGAPYFLNFHTSPLDDDSEKDRFPGNTFICGFTGTGKTSLLVSLLFLATKYKGLRFICFDKDRSLEVPIRAIGGQYFPLRNGERTGLNPFLLEPTDKNILFCIELVRILVRGSGIDAIPISPTEDLEIESAVRVVMGKDVTRALKRLSGVLQNLKAGGSGSVKSRLTKWCGDNQFGWVFDNPTDIFDSVESTYYGFDYTDFIDYPIIRTPLMSYLLHITQSKINGQPFIYAMEEFWKPLNDESLSDFALNKQKTIRKENGLGILITQDPKDMLDQARSGGEGSPAANGPKMISQCATQIYLPNPKADRDDYVKGFKLTNSEFEIISNFGEHSRMFLVKQGHRSAVCKFDLSGMPELLKIVSASPDDAELADSIRAQYGNDPDLWLPEYFKRIAKKEGK